MSTPVQPVLSNRLFLDFQHETPGIPHSTIQAAGDASAGTTFVIPTIGAAATQVDLNAVAEPFVLVGLVQPTRGARKLTLTFTDGDVSIDAFSVTVVGTDETGAAASETLTFAGGLVQTTATYFKTLTSITLNSINGNGAGDTLDAAWAAATRMVDLLQPAGPRKLRLTVLDANVSVSAFSITVVGVAYDGSAVNETFVFAGGLVQTTTAYIKTLTSVSLASHTGAGTPDTLAADWSDGLPLLLPVKDGDYSLALEDPSREQEHLLGDPDAQIMVQTGRNLTGDLKIGLWPHLWKTLLDFGYQRTSSELPGGTFRLTVPGVETRRHRDVKCNRMSIDGAAEGDIDLTLGLQGWYEDNNGGSILSYPNSYIVPAIASLQHMNCAFIISLNASTNFANRIKPKGLSSFSVTCENNLQPGTPIEDRIDVVKDGAIEFLVTGRKKVALRFTAAFDRDEYGTLQRSRLFTQFKMVGASRAYTSYLTVDVGGAVAGSSVAVPTTTDPALLGFAVGMPVLFDNYGTSNLPCVGVITVVDSVAPFGLTIDVLDENVAAGDHIFRGAIEVKTARAVTPRSPLGHSFGQFTTVSIEGDIFSGGPEPLSYKARDETLPA